LSQINPVSHCSDAIPAIQSGFGNAMTAVAEFTISASRLLDAAGK
jgi:hypothetical protein